jgi:hypothetical protein
MQSTILTKLSNPKERQQRKKQNPPKPENKLQNDGFLPITALNVYGLYSSIKSEWLSGFRKEKTQIHAAYRDSPPFQGHTDRRRWDRRRYSMHMEAEVRKGSCSETK